MQPTEQNKQTNQPTNPGSAVCRLCAGWRGSSAGLHEPAGPRAAPHWSPGGAPSPARWRCVYSQPCTSSSHSEPVRRAAVSPWPEQIPLQGEEGKVPKTSVKTTLRVPLPGKQNTNPHSETLSNCSRVSRSARSAGCEITAPCTLSSALGVRQGAIRDGAEHSQGGSGGKVWLVCSLLGEMSSAQWDHHPGNDLHPKGGVCLNMITNNCHDSLFWKPVSSIWKKKKEVTCHTDEILSSFMV